MLSNPQRLSVAILFVCFCLGLTLPAIGQEKTKKLSDGEITRLLVGKWVAYRDKFKLTFEVKKDGTYQQEWLDPKCQDNKAAFSGKWKVANGKIAITVTQVDAPGVFNVKVGDKVPKMIIISINKKTLNAFDEDEPKSKATTWTRVKN